jgi:hypothetical protein
MDGTPWGSSVPHGDSYNLIFHLGGYAQYCVSERFALQGNMNYQGCNTEWTRGSGPHGSGYLFFTSFNLNGVFNFPREKNTQFYFLCGGGFNNGNWATFDALYFNLTGGMGMKIYFKSTSMSAITTGLTLHHLIGDNKTYANFADYLRLNIGFEF